MMRCKSFLCKNLGIFLFFPFLLDWICRVCRRCVTSFKVILEKQAFWPHESKPPISWTYSRSFNSKRLAEKFFTLKKKKRTLWELLHWDVGCFSICVAALIDGIQRVWKMIKSRKLCLKQNKTCNLSFVFQLWSAPRCFPLRFFNFPSLIKKKRPLPSVHMGEVEQICVFALTCVNLAERVTSESVTVVFPGMFERSFVPPKRLFLAKDES